jgi:monooxygenase
VSADVAVVGAGIGGAVLALALGTRGWKVTLLERERVSRTIPRPEILWGATPAALDRFGIGEIIRNRASLRVDGIDVRRGRGRLLAISRRVLDSAGVAAYSTDPGMTRSAIADAAVATGKVSVIRGIEVTELMRAEGRVLGVTGRRDGERVEYRARLVVGDDGAHSVIRKAMGGTIELAVFPLDFVTAAIGWPNELPPDRVSVRLNPAAFEGSIPAIGCMPWPGGRGVLLMPLPHERVESLFQSTAEGFWSEVARLTPLAEELRAQLQFPADFQRIRRPYGHAAAYVADGVAIIGDAAHPMSPAGGQGANASIWDALALADVAHQGLAAGDLSRQRLARYELLRRPSNSASVAITERAVVAFNLLRQVPGLSRLVPAALGIFDSLPALKATILSAVATTFVTR